MHFGCLSQALSSSLSSLPLVSTVLFSVWLTISPVCVWVDVVCASLHGCGSLLSVVLPPPAGPCLLLPQPQVSSINAFMHFSHFALLSPLIFFVCVCVCHICLVWVWLSSLLVCAPLFSFLPVILLILFIPLILAVVVFILSTSVFSSTLCGPSKNFHFFHYTWVFGGLFFLPAIRIRSGGVILFWLL